MRYHPAAPEGVLDPHVARAIVAAVGVISGGRVTAAEQADAQLAAHTDVRPLLDVGDTPRSLFRGESLERPPDIVPTLPPTHWSLAGRYWPRSNREMYMR